MCTFELINANLFTFELKIKISKKNLNKSFFVMKPVRNFKPHFEMNKNNIFKNLIKKVLHTHGTKFIDHKNLFGRRLINAYCVSFVKWFW